MFNREWMWLSLVKYSRVLTNRSGDDTPNEYLKYTQQPYNAHRERWQTLWTNYCCVYYLVYSSCLSRMHILLSNILLKQWLKFQDEENTVTFQYAKDFVPTTYMNENGSHLPPEKQFSAINILSYQNYKSQGDHKNFIM